MIGNCIKTGAAVFFNEYQQTIVADLFSVGDTIVMHMAPKTFDSDFVFNNQRPATHEAYIGTSGFLDKVRGLAVVKACNFAELVTTKE